MTKPVRILFFKSHIETYTRKDGAVVQAHDNKVQKQEAMYYPKGTHETQKKSVAPGQPSIAVMHKDTNKEVARFHSWADAEDHIAGLEGGTPRPQPDAPKTETFPKGHIFYSSSHRSGGSGKGDPSPTYDMVMSDDPDFNRHAKVGREMPYEEAIAAAHAHAAKFGHNSYSINHNDIGGGSRFTEGGVRVKKDIMSKAIEPRILFLKSHVKQFTRTDGTIVKEHDDKRQKKAEAAPVERAPAQEEAPASQPAKKPEANNYGHHNVEEGDSLKFKAGDFAGSGKVKFVGQDGATVTDNSGRDHEVHWEEVTGRGGDQAAPEEKSTPVEAAKPAEQPAKEVKTGDGDGKVIGKIDGNTARRAKAEDISRALFNTSETDSLPKKARQSEKFDSWEKIEAGAPQALEEFKGMLGKVAKTLDLETGKRPATFDFAQEEENAKAKEKGKQAEKLDPTDYMTPEHWDNNRGFLFIGPLKTKSRAEAKVKADYTDKETGEEEWNQLKDMVRATIAVPSVTQIPKVLAEMKKAGIVLAQQPKNNLTGEGLHGSGYRDVNLIVKMPNGMLAELQIHCKPMTQAKEHGHEYYAENAAIERQYDKNDEERKTWPEEHKAKHAENHGKMKNIYDKAWDKSIGHDDHDISAPTLQKSLTKRTMVLLKARRAS